MTRQIDHECEHWHERRDKRRHGCEWHALVGEICQRGRREELVINHFRLKPQTARIGGKDKLYEAATCRSFRRP